jgi:magnesium transporter
VQTSSPRPSWTSVSSGKLEWLDIIDPTEEDTDLLAEKYPFHPLNLQDTLSKRQLSRVEEHDSYLFVLFHFPTVGPDGLVIRNQLSIFVGEGYVVTLHGSNLRAVKEMAEGLNLAPTKRSSEMKSPAHIVYAVADMLVDGLFPFLDKLRDDLDGIEDKVFDEKVSPAAQINELRRRVADLRRICLPLRSTLDDAWARLRRYGTEELSAYFKDVIDHVDKVTEALDQASETIEIYKDTNFLLSTDKTNKVLTLLTIIFTLTLPAAVVAAVYGMNVALPLGNGQGPPTFLGPYTTFLILLAVMITPAALMAWYFRRAGWL